MAPKLTKTSLSCDSPSSNTTEPTYTRLPTVLLTAEPGDGVPGPPTAEPDGNSTPNRAAAVAAEKALPPATDSATGGVTGGSAPVTKPVAPLFASSLAISALTSSR